ncbi:MAG: alpha/beta hydrolase [Rhodospirillaceae bacterium]|nr:alpha/beta hydrolase [Rhodospirillaceae bacterium]
MNNPGKLYESGYNLRARHPDFEQFVERWQRESDEARLSPDCLLDQRYGDGPNMNLDIFPLAGALRPILIFIHGGYWRAMDKALFTFPAIGLNQAGVVYASINYALAPAVTLDEIVEQSRQAVAWVYQNAEKYGGDPKRIHVSGHSAGGHLTGMMLSTDWAARGLPCLALAGGIPISGIFDLMPILQTSINDDVRLDEESAERNSPMTFVPENGPPMISAVGGGETDEFLRQSKEYAEAWQEKGGSAQYLPLEGFHHFDVICELGRTGSELNDAVLAQIEK